MALLTAKQLKRRESPEFIVDLGDGSEVLCRFPDLPTLIFEKFLPLQMVNKVLGIIRQWTGTESEINAESLDNSDEVSQFVDRWLVAAMVSPRCVLKQEDATGEDVIWVNDLRMPTKIHIFKETFSSEVEKRAAAAEAAERFRAVGHGEGSGQGGEAVQPAPVLAGGD